MAQSLEEKIRFEIVRRENKLRRPLSAIEKDKVRKDIEANKGAIDKYSVDLGGLGSRPMTPAEKIMKSREGQDTTPKGELSKADKTLLETFEEYHEALEIHKKKLEQLGTYNIGYTERMTEGHAWQEKQLELLDLAKKGRLTRIQENKDGQ